MFRVTRNCAHYKRLISDHIDQPLASGKERRLAKHLEKCPGCRAELAFYADLKSQAARLEQATAPAYLWERIACRLDEHPWGEDQPAPLSMAIQKRWRWSLNGAIHLAGAVATVALLVAFIINPSEKIDERDAQVPTAAVRAGSADIENVSLFMLANQGKFPSEVRSFYVNWLSGIDRQIKTIKTALDRYPENKQIQAQLAYAYASKLRLYRQMQAAVPDDNMIRNPGYRKGFIDKGGIYD
jgi:hypothetical protein